MSTLVSDAALHALCVGKQHAVFKRLLSEGLDPNRTIASPHGPKPLILLASEHQCDQMVGLLFEYGAKLDVEFRLEPLWFHVVERLSPEHLKQFLKTWQEHPKRPLNVQKANLIKNLSDQRLKHDGECEHQSQPSIFRAAWLEAGIRIKGLTRLCGQPKHQERFEAWLTQAPEDVSLWLQDSDPAFQEWRAHMVALAEASHLNHIKQSWQESRGIESMAGIESAHQETTKPKRL